MKKKINLHTGLGEFIIITPFIGFGDLLYHTPVLRIMSRIYKGVDIWCFNTEPFLNNPHVNKLFKIDSDTVNTVPHEFYFDFISEVSADKNVFIKNLYPSNVYSPEYFSLSIIHSSLPDSEKHLTYNWTKKDEVSAKVKARGALSQRDKLIVAVNPALGWPSRTLPYEYYRILIDKILSLDDIVVLVGKDVSPKKFMPSQATKEVNPVFQKNETKSLYDFDDLVDHDNVVDLTNKLTLA
jgi:hypothetical protein